MNWLKKTYFRIKNPLPKIYLPHDQAVKKIQERWLFSFLIFLAFALWYTYEYSAFKVEQNMLVPLVVANKDLSAPHEITAGDLVLIELPQKDIPVNVYADTEALVGKTLLANVVDRQMILPHQVHENLDPESVSADFGDLFAFSLDESWMSSRFPEIRKNDRVDIVVSNPKGDVQISATVAQGVKVIDLQVAKDKKKTLILNMTKDEAEAILFAQGLRLPMQLLVYPGGGVEVEDETSIIADEAPNNR